ncbi:hypothetical protein AeNC1_004005 [Aphanomyces euteiches]|nr:hypothetical protein AeNC1_004005 [Aphanomyces euteiches]
MSKLSPQPAAHSPSQELGTPYPPLFRWSPGSSRRHSRYELRSGSQQSRSDREEKEERGDEHFSRIVFKVDVRLKETVNQRLDKAKTLGTLTVACETWEDVKRQLWQRYSRHFENLALCDRENDSPVWSTKVDEPTIDEFSRRFSLRLDTKQLKAFESSSHGAYILKHSRETFMLSVYKYGTSLVSMPDLTQYEAQCLGPIETDRAGAASESQIQDIMASLKVEWGHLLSAQEISWRLWAVLIVRMKKTTHERMVIMRQGPPSSLIGGFSAQSSTAEIHRARVAKSVKMAFNLAQVVDSELETFERKFDLLKAELTTLRHIVKTQMELVRSFGEDLAVHPDDTRVLTALRAIPRQDDHDHDI